MDIITKYSESKNRINQLITEELPKLELQDMASLTSIGKSSPEILVYTKANVLICGSTKQPLRPFFLRVDMFY